MSTNIKILRMNDVIQKTGLARSTIYDRLNHKSPRYDDSFPKPIKIGLSAVGWLEHEINAWILDKANTRTISF
ncbi:AlpA family transcriptional regulator [Edwardsiella ictaluri]|uniref:AlpA family transcriptional regulator n=1 Tax=Plesiomonas shigelloides TaxID=703 RepID=A0A8I2B732_PLESH|nr:MULTISPECIES: AlpA family transcriptional regulator [Enterobacterales]ARD39373.1 AlpA family transcriptional regulator [Edwardsiella ictaluri]MBO1109767.1 AlpA family transcriptional regulator [Plesiomonas shigelloides]QPW27794.1 AlpA family transcriptional regulator [Edwardsiella ictaluri]